MQFEAQIERDEVVCRHHHEHAEGREQHEHGIFKQQKLGAAEVIERHQQRQRGADENDDLQEAREAVRHESAAEDSRRSAAIENGHACCDQDADREPGNGPPRRFGVRREDADHQKRDSAEGEDQLRQDDV